MNICRRVGLAFHRISFFFFAATKMNEGLESKGNSRAAAKLEGPSRQSWSWKAVEDETEKFSPPWYGASREGWIDLAALR